MQILAQVDERGHGEGEQLARAQVVEAVGQDARGEVIFAPGLILAEVAHLVERVRQALDEVFLEPGDARSVMPSSGAPSLKLSRSTIPLARDAT